MDEAAKKPTAAPKFRRRWHQFSLRTLMLATTAFCVWVGVLAHRANQQKQAILVIKKLRGGAFYDFQCKNGTVPNVSVQPPGPAWLRNSVGIDYLANLTVATFWDRPTDTDLEQIASLPTLKHVNMCADHGDIRRLARLANLESLTLFTDSPQDVIDEVRQLQAALPKVRIDCCKTPGPIPD